MDYNASAARNHLKRFHEDDYEQLLARGKFHLLLLDWAILIGTGTATTTFLVMQDFW